MTSDGLDYRPTADPTISFRNRLPTVVETHTHERGKVCRPHSGYWWLWDIPKPPVAAVGSADFASFVRVRFNYCGKAIPKTDRRICGWPVIKAIGRQYQAHQHQLKAIGAGRKSPCRAILAFREGRKVFKTTDRLGTHWGTVPLLCAHMAPQLAGRIRQGRCTLEG